MKKMLIAAAVGMLVAGSVAAQESPWLVRARAVNLNMANNDSTSLGLTVNDKTIGEVDVSYFFNKNVAAELILTVPQTQTVNSTAAGYLGTIKHLPPTLTLQYHFTDFNGFKPYVGAGINYTIFYKRNNILDGAASVSDSSVGVVGQLGFDYMLDKNWGLNVDLKYIQMATKVYVGGDKVGTVNLNPLAVGLGVSYRF